MNSNGDVSPRIWIWDFEVARLNWSLEKDSSLKFTFLQKPVGYSPFETILQYRKQTIIHPLNSEKDENARQINRMYTGSFDSVGYHATAAQDNAERYTTISGVVKDKLNKKKLEYVT